MFGYHCDFVSCVTAVQISNCVISAFQWSLMYTRKLRCGRETTWYHCKIRYVSNLQRHHAGLPAIAWLLSFYFGKMSKVMQCILFSRFCIFCGILFPVVEMMVLLWQCCHLVRMCLKLHTRHMYLTPFGLISIPEGRFVLDEWTTYSRRLCRLCHIRWDLKLGGWHRIFTWENSGGLLTSCSAQW